MKRHTHFLLPNKPIHPSFYYCTSCLFRCTPAARGYVIANTDRHKLITRRDPESKEVFNV